MHEVVDKLIIFICCIALYLYQIDYLFSVVPIVLVLFLASLSSYYESPHVRIFIYGLFLLMGLFYPNFLYFIPVMGYDVLFGKKWWIFFFGILALVYRSGNFSRQDIVFILLFILISFVFAYKSRIINGLVKEYYYLRDSAKEMEIRMKETNSDILESKDYEINVATLKERNRISKELHDNIGHLLSRSLLQIGALLTITKEEMTKETLTGLKESISEGMDNIRATIHNMHDESVDLYVSINKLIEEFMFCEIVFEYDITELPPIKVRYGLIGIVKEALANVIKHSGATKVAVILKEHPAFYQLIVYDNGSKKVTNLNEGFYSESGMGLMGISDRVKGFEGTFYVTQENGFKIIVTIPRRGIA